MRRFIRWAPLLLVLACGEEERGGPLGASRLGETGARSLAVATGIRLTPDNAQEWFVLGLNNMGQAGLYTYVPCCGLLWDAGEFRAPSALVGYTDINDAGVAAATEFGMDRHAYVVVNGVATALPGLVGNTRTEAWAINAAGQIVGMANGPDGASHAVMWTNGVVQDLGRLPGYGGRWSASPGAARRTSRRGTGARPPA
ncbi:MAG: hypothetical protein IPK12_19445 [Gemmatimonadetes bacterium]|nr:hypothetical protein [Gemmatimonadota bacterium]